MDRKLRPGDIVVDIDFDKINVLEKDRLQQYTIEFINFYNNQTECLKQIFPGARIPAKDMTHYQFALCRGVSFDRLKEISKAILEEITSRQDKVANLTSFNY